MAVLFMDGFDHYPAGNITSKWDGAVDQQISTTTKKTGNGSLHLRHSNAYCLKNLGANYQTLCVGFMLLKTPTNSPVPGLEILDASNVNLKLIFNSNGSLGVARNTTILASIDNVLVNEEWGHFQVKVVVDDSVGSVVIKKNDVTICELTNVDTKQGANAYSNIVAFKNYGPNNSDIFIDDVYIAEDFLGVCVVDTKLPSGAGSTTQFTPSAGANYQCVGEASMNNDTDYVYSATPGNIDTYAFADLSYAVGVVKAVQVNAFAKLDDTGARKIGLVTRPGNTDHVSTDKVLITLMDHYFELHEINPDTSEAWTVETVNASEFGIKVTE